MPLTEIQVEEYKAQAAALRTKLRSSGHEVISLKQTANQAKTNPNLFLAKLGIASEAKKEFSDAWDRLVLIHIKLGVATEFPQRNEESLRTEVSEAFANAKALEITLLQPETPPSTSQLSQTCGSSRTESKSGFALLERIRLPHFDGEVTAWARYRDIFTSLVDNDPSLDPVTKLYLLRDSLSGEALSVINKFDITAANYPLAWKSLTDSYENQRVLASAYLEKILSHRMSTRPNLSEFQRFMTEVSDNVASFKSLKLTDAEDKILALAMLRTLDYDTRQKFELNHIGTDFPSSDSITRFIRNKCQALKLSDTHHISGRTSPTTPNRSYSPKNVRFSGRSSPSYNQHRSFVTSPSFQEHSTSPRTQQRRSSPYRPTRSFTPSPTRSLCCPFCQENHILARCPLFSGLSIEDRQEFAAKWKGCKNCLNPEHSTQDCRSKWNCRICQERHHSLLHRQLQSAKRDSDQEVSAHANCGQLELQRESQSNCEVLVILGTARAFIKDSAGLDHAVRILLDTGSHRSFITNDCATSLQLPIRKASSQITGLGGKLISETKGTINVTLTTLLGRKIKMNAAVLPDRITPPLPQRPLPKNVYERFKTLQLADSRFTEPQEVHILLGADLFDEICTGSFYKLDPDFPSILPTIFGDVIMGTLKTSREACLISLFCQPFKAISSQLEAFWKLEEPLTVSRQSPEDQICEKHYVKTVTRNTDGRYVVRLPFSADPETLGDNHALAQKRFLSTEAKLTNNIHLRQEYVSFMEEYENLGHMQAASETSPYLIPHFGIMQNKLRVVFDASCKSTNGVSLNDILYPGPKLQTDISDVMTGFRLFPIAITTDIVKMYRQILLHPLDRKFQHVLWRKSPDQDLIEQELNTVTYGITSSPFHALRTIRQLIQDEGAKFPLAVQRLTNQIFVDDIAIGADSVTEAKELCQDLIRLFNSGGFALSKWCSNDTSVLPGEPHPNNFPEIKVLGLIWNPQDDTFAYVIHELPSKMITKRVLLSIITRIFDPLGFIAPVVFTGKLLMQELWKNKSDWDDYLTPQLHERWLYFSETWNELSKVRIPRFTHSRNKPCKLIGFCDASSHGYAAVVYLNVESSAYESKTFLLTAKTKVAPIKYISIARLELCGAFLLAKLVSRLHLPDVDIRQRIMFTDSMVALGWIHTPSHMLHVFEANRVAAIHEYVSDAEWRHVSTQDNSSDCGSRGLTPSQIVTNPIWWDGPPWLKLPPSNWPSSFFTPVEADDKLPDLRAFALNKVQVDISWMTKFSSFLRLTRVVARILRFSRRPPYKFTCHSEPLRSSEINYAALICARSTQQALFQKGTLTPELSSLNPFQDELGILRVGGRLINAPISSSAKHPVILPKSSHLAKLIVHNVHQTYFHAGPTLTLNILRTKYWIPSALRFVKSQLSRCVTCFRRRPKLSQPLMAPLPSDRFTVGRPFLHTGVDYAGPFTIRDTLRRKPILSKAYICLFICLSTKAIHLEAVTSLTTEAFIASLDRFVARRGKPAVIHSDNATNFVGAHRYLKDVMTFLKTQNEDIINHLAPNGIDWQFIPPRSPHFGGLWEAGVKSTKSLLKSSIAPTPFTYEELSTILARVESILNSRPICPLTDDAESCEPLTPGHFLIGAPLCALPEEEISDLQTNRLSRWQLVQKNVQQLWTRWRREYLNTLQQRSKWRKLGTNFRPNDLVVLLEKTLPCGQWPMARITEVHPGTDGTVRVVTVKTPSGAKLKRSVHRLALLPIPTSEPSPPAE